MSDIDLSKVPAAMERRLLELAAAARSNSHAPYSKFRVGAAVLTQSGAIFTGCNVECASFGNTLCAERNAIAAAVAAGHRELLAVAVVADAVRPTPPCGSCRQVMAEFNPDMLVIFSDNVRARIERRHLHHLLPDLFEGNMLSEVAPREEEGSADDEASG